MEPDKNELIKLELENEEIAHKFAVLVLQTEEVLNCEKVTVERLISLIAKIHSKRKTTSNKLIIMLNTLENTDIAKALSIMSDYWSFFDYELLSIIIESFKEGHPDLILKRIQFVSACENYCQRKLSEVPYNAFTSKKVSSNDFRIKIDVNIFDVTLKEVKKKLKSSSLTLDTSLRLVGFEPAGYVELICTTMHEIDETCLMSNEQKKELSRRDIVRIYNKHLPQFYVRNPSNIVACGLTGSGQKNILEGIIGQELVSKDGSYAYEVMSKKWGDEHAIRVYDTPGHAEKMVECLEFIKKNEGNVDLLIYCISPEMSKNNEAILKKLKEIWGNNIWEHCVVVLTSADKIRYNKIEEWKRKIRKMFQNASINTSSLRIVPAGSASKPSLRGGAKLWLSDLWNETVKAAPQKTSEILIFMNSHRLKPDCIEENYQQPLWKQSIIPDKSNTKINTCTKKVDNATLAYTLLVGLVGVLADEGNVNTVKVIGVAIAGGLFGGYTVLAGLEAGSAAGIVLGGPAGAVIGAGVGAAVGATVAVGAYLFSRSRN